MDAISEATYEQFSEAAYQSVDSLFGKLTAVNVSRSILLYQAHPRWREVSLAKLKATYSNVTFECVPTSKSAPLPDGRYDVIFVPLYGFTQAGYRLGHGGGWYDKLLAAQPRARRIGVGLEAGLIDFDVEEHDVPVDILITEKRCELLRDRTLG